MESNLAVEPQVLIALAQMGNSEALVRLLEIYRRYIQIMASIHMDKTLKQRLSASDVVQETFVQALRNFRQFRGTTEPELLQWLRRIAATRMAMARRQLLSKRQDVRLEERLFEAMEDWSQRIASKGNSGSSPSQQASKREQVVILANALSELPENYREVILLRHFQELQFAAIAEQLGRSVDSVKNIWVRAIRKLQELIVDSST